MKYLLFIVLIVGCYTPQKAHKQGSRWIANYPTDAVTTLKGMFPSQSSGSDTSQFSDSSQFLDYMHDLETDLTWSMHKIDSLKNLKIHDSLYFNYSECDSIQSSVIFEQDKQINSLKYKLSHIPAIKIETKITDTVPDRAQIFVLESKNNQLIYTNQSLDSQNKKHEKSRDLWRTIALISLGINVLFIYLKFKK